jgi:thiamine-phosphate pyrophosphorylase
LDDLRLYLVTDRSLRPDGDLVAVVRDCLAAGLPAVQVREKDLAAAALAALCRSLLPLTRAAGARLVVNDRADVALAVGADGVQRTGTSLPVADLRAVAGGRLLIVASVHAEDEAVAAAEAGADWIVFGPVHDTPSKRRYGPPQGLARLERVARAVPVPVIAIGGITPARVADVMAAGARGVAVISAILAAPSPADATRRFLEALDRASLPHAGSTPPRAGVHDPRAAGPPAARDPRQPGPAPAPDPRAGSTPTIALGPPTPVAVSRTPLP